MGNGLCHQSRSGKSLTMDSLTWGCRKCEGEVLCGHALFQSFLRGISISPISSMWDVT